MRVANKAQMYDLLRVGAFGNTIPTWTNLKTWNEDPEARDKYLWWGVRSVRPGDTRTRLNVYYTEVPGYLYASGLIADGFNLSMMVEKATGAETLWEGDVFEDGAGGGLSMSGNFAPLAGHGKWREHMKTPRLMTGTLARHALRDLLTPGSFDDLMELRELFPDHVYEMSIMDVCVGSLPHRNAVIWEVRDY